MKKLLLAICLIFSFATCSFAGDVIFAPLIEKPTSDEIDTYIIVNNDGGTDVVHVFNVDDESYAVVDSDGTSIVTKYD